MIKQISSTREPDRPATRPTPDPAWRLLGHAFTGYDWHGGYHAAVPAPTVSRPGLIARWLQRLSERRADRELRDLGARDRLDIGLPPVSRTDPGLRWDALWQRGGSGAVPRVGDCCR